MFRRRQREMFFFPAEKAQDVRRPGDGVGSNLIGSFTGSRRVLTTAMDNWLKNLFALAPVRAYAYVR